MCGIEPDTSLESEDYVWIFKLDAVGTRMHTALKAESTVLHTSA
jgi:hypothetical protein